MALYLIKVPENNPEAILKDILSFWLREKKLDAILVPAISPIGVVTRALVSAPDKISQTAPLLPAMATNGAAVVAEIAQKSGGTEAQKVGILLRPCELRAVVELVKLQQVSLDGLVLLGIDCPGTYRAKDYSVIAGGDRDFNNNFIRRQDGYLTDTRMRNACQVCEVPTPLVYDIAFGFLGLNPDESLLASTATEKGANLLDGLGKEGGAGIEPIPAEPPARKEFLDKFRQARAAELKKRLGELDKKALGAENLVRYFADCLNCHNCMKVCPVCYCRECFFDSDALKRSLDQIVRLSRGKGMLRMPADTLLFHITRMNHMMTSCVQCGICEDSCPVSIGLSILFKKVSRNAQAAFDYLSGRSLEEPLPLVTFREDEFRTIGEE